MYELILILILFFLLINIVYWSIKTGISPMFSSKTVSLYLNNEIKKLDKNTIIDLGSGWGTLLLYLALKNPDKKFIGYELSPIPFYFSKLLAFLFKSKNLYFYKQNFLDVKFKTDTLYIVYLFPEGMDKIEDKIKKEDIKPDLLISNTFSFKKIKDTKKVELNDILKTPVYFYNRF